MRWKGVLAALDGDVRSLFVIEMAEWRAAGGLEGDFGWSDSGQSRRLIIS